MVHVRDQEIFSVFQDVTVDELDDGSALVFSLQPTEGNLEDFDFDLSFDTKAFGASSKNISVKGKYTVGDDEIEFTCKVA